MTIINMNLKNKGMILPLTLFLITLLTWLFSILVLSYKNEVQIIETEIKINDRYWKLENLSKIAEYEIYKGDLEVKKNIYKDIIEYFEGKELIWIDTDKISKSGFKRYKVKQNGKEVFEKINLKTFGKNTLEIELLKNITIEKEVIQVVINLFYEYKDGEDDFFKSSKREIKGVEVRIKNEDIGNK
ncbi:MAG: hypothetical protein ACRDB9_04235 [Cetobacterium sp.]